MLEATNYLMFSILEGGCPHFLRTFLNRSDDVTHKKIWQAQEQCTMQLKDHRCTNEFWHSSAGKHSLDFFLFVFLNQVVAEGCLEVGTLLILANLPGFCICKKASLLSYISKVMKMKTISFCFAGFVWRFVASLYKFLNILPYEALPLCTYAEDWMLWEMSHRWHGFANVPFCNFFQDSATL